jgi:hypothetical protein
VPFGDRTEWRFYEAEFVKTRCENSLCLIFCSFLPTSDNNSTPWLWCLIICDGVYVANYQTPKSVTPSSAQRSWFKANNGINGRGPPEAGRMPFMPAVSLNQWSGALPKRWSCFPAKVFLRCVSSFFCFRLFCSSIFWPSVTSAVRNASDLFGARFKLLSAGAGAPNMVIYAMSKSGDSNERSNLSLRVLFAQAPFQTRAVAAKKFICELAGVNSVASPSS